MAPRRVELDEHLPLRLQDKLVEIRTHQSGYVAVCLAGPRLGFNKRRQLPLFRSLEEFRYVVRVVLLLVVKFKLIPFLANKHEMRGFISFHAQLLGHFFEKASAVLPPRYRCNYSQAIAQYESRERAKGQTLGFVVAQQEQETAFFVLEYFFNRFAVQRDQLRGRKHCYQEEQQ